MCVCVCVCVCVGVCGGGCVGGACDLATGVCYASCEPALARRAYAYQNVRGVQVQALFTTGQRQDLAFVPFMPAGAHARARTHMMPEGVGAIG